MVLVSGNDDRRASTSSSPSTTVSMALMLHDASDKGGRSTEPTAATRRTPSTTRRAVPTDRSGIGPHPSLPRATALGCERRPIPASPADPSEDPPVPVKSLRQEEAIARASLLSVTSYDIAIDLTDLPDGPAFRAVSTIRFTATAGAETFVDCCAEVESATLNGEPLPAAEEGRIALSGLRDDNELVVASVQSDTEHGRGVHRAVDPADKNVYLWTTFEPDEARYAWACFDQPDLKAPHAFTVTAPASWTVVSNSGDPVVEDVDGGRRWTFEPTPPLSTYNPVVVAGPFVEIRKEAGGYDLGLYARQTLAGVLERDSEQLFTLTEQGLGFFGDRFGMPFPQRSYDQVFLPEFGGAMENYGCVTWTDNILRRHEPTTGEWQWFTNVLLHEMAHMWFGNIVTMRWWDDLWLNEAFAEFACMWAAERATAYGDTAANNLVHEKLDAYLADQGPTSHPIYQPVPSVADAESIFDSITYPKGAAVLKQLMYFVGEETFSQGHDGLLRRARVGQHHPRRPRRRARAGQRPRPAAVAYGVARDRRRRPARHREDGRRPGADRRRRARRPAPAGRRHRRLPPRGRRARGGRLRPRRGRRRAHGRRGSARRRPLPGEPRRHDVRRRRGPTPPGERC